jgi:hypothetical protein
MTAQNCRKWGHFKEQCLCFRFHHEENMPICFSKKALGQYCWDANRMFTRACFCVIGSLNARGDMRPLQMAAVSRCFSLATNSRANQYIHKPRCSTLLSGYSSPYLRTNVQISIRSTSGSPKKSVLSKLFQESEIWLSEPPHVVSSGTATALLQPTHNSLRNVITLHGGSRHCATSRKVAA